MEESTTASISNVCNEHDDDDYERILLNEDVTTNDGLPSCKDDADYEQQPQQKQNMPCKICGVSDQRKMCHFAYDPEAVPTVDAPNSASEDVFLHVFCGKTAAILSHVEDPDLEILTAQGIRNKHGNATGVYVALKRTRPSIPINDFDETPKVYYISKEFESHLAIVKKELETAAAYNSANNQAANEHGNTNVPPILPAPTSSSNEVEQQLQIVSNPIQPYSESDEGVPPTAALDETYSLPPLSPDFHQHNKRKQQELVPNFTENQQSFQPHDVQQENMMLPSKKQRYDSDMPPNMDLVQSPTDVMSHPQVLLTPYQIKMDRIRVVMEQHKASGYSIIRGVSCSNGEDDDHEDDEENIDVNQLTQEQMNVLRVILYTPQREQMVDEYSRLVLGDKYGQDVLMFDTNFSYHVLHSYQVFRSKYSKVRDAAVKFDMLLAFTDSIKEHDVWMHDHEVGWGGEKMVVGLARTWKNMLSRTDEQLGIDTEFSRPGVMALLEDFKTAVEGAHTIVGNAEPQMKFSF
mmetsp:Transcript_619/g.877  ORF Transcript_619/g.877 Transcript_619/m.877 type:complete len:520 (-) Transcript_619:127-1686(-)